ncbi:hypothetical protein FKO59_26040 [Burkholderia pseudomallei]|nr:hypothetical protein FKO42_26065 [Burkholderia pseudomallei]QDH41118.1 hypothetical protein FKO59_26040 [Burkholderia pseudomallei]
MRTPNGSRGTGCSRGSGACSVGNGARDAAVRLTTHDSRLTTHDSRLTTHDSRLTTRGHDAGHDEGERRRSAACRPRTRAASTDDAQSAGHALSGVEADACAPHTSKRRNGEIACPENRQAYPF